MENGRWPSPSRKANAAGYPVRHILFPYSGHDFNTTYDGITNQALLQIISQFAIDHGAGPAGLRTTHASHRMASGFPGAKGG